MSDIFDRFLNNEFIRILLNISLPYEGGHQDIILTLLKYSSELRKEGSIEGSELKCHFQDHSDRSEGYG